MTEYNGAERSTTERLRQLLDERGVKWEDADPYQDATAWVGSSNIEYVAHEGISFDGPTGRLILFCLTPEQAVEATLGRGTCRIPETRIDHGSIEYNGMTAWRRCSACGAEVLASPPHYCPNCGRRVEE